MSYRPYMEVITGDLIQSRAIPVEARKRLPDRLAEGLGTLSRPSADGPSATTAPVRALCFEVSRGDSFQIVLEGSGGGLRAMLFLLAHLWHGVPRTDALAPRMALGLGHADYLELLPQTGAGPVPRGFQADGEVFVRSGELLEELTRERRRLGVRSPWPDVNAELAVECLFLDEVVRRWSPAQAAAVMLALRGATQVHIAKEQQVSQSAIAQRLRGAGMPAVEALLKRYESLVAARVADGNAPPAA